MTTYATGDPFPSRPLQPPSTVANNAAHIPTLRLVIPLEGDPYAAIDSPSEGGTQRLLDYAAQSTIALKMLAAFVEVTT